MPKIVVNRCFGGFCLSEEAYALLGIPWDGYGHGFNIKRDDPKLVEVVKQLGSKADGEYAQLQVVDVPDDIVWEIEDYDGHEKVAEKHRSW